MYCVILGDIAHSRALNPKDRALVTQKIQAVLDGINLRYADCILAQFGLVRGDAFEGVLYAQRVAPMIVQEVVKAVYSINKTKMRISVVTDALTVVSSDRNTADGPAFHIAAEQIEQLKREKSDHWLQVSFVTKTDAQGLVESVVDLLAALTKGWTDRQREIAWAMDELGQQAAVSKRLGITPGVVSKQVRAANYSAYRLAWKNLTEYLAHTEEDAAKD